MSAALRQLRTQVEDFGETAQDTGRRAAGAASGYANHASTRLGELWSEIEALVSHRGPDMRERARGYAHDAGDFASDLTDQVIAATRHRPLAAIGIAVAATWLVTTLLHAPRRR
jgi:ElaB/YqjD/DUF883 family membrane-anchored ribosome-binding protein